METHWKRNPGYYLRRWSQFLTQVCGRTWSPPTGRRKKSFRRDAIWLQVRTHLGVELQRSGVFDEGLDDASAAQGVGGHHEHLVLLHRVEEGPHVGSDGLRGHDDRRRGRGLSEKEGGGLVPGGGEGPMDLSCQTEMEAFLTLWLFFGGENLLVGLPSTTSGALRLVLRRDLESRRVYQLTRDLQCL